MSKSIRASVVAVRMGLALVALIAVAFAAYNTGARDARTKIARAQVPANATRAWSGRVLVPGGKDVIGTVYEVVDPSGQPLVRYTVQDGNPTPYIVRFDASFRQ